MKARLILFSVVLFGSMIVMGQTVKTGGVIYQIKDGHAIIYDVVNKNATEITVEGSVMYKGQTYKVTELKRRRISGYWYSPFCKERCPALKHVTFSSTCTEIMGHILEDSNVETVTIPNTVTIIGKDAFGAWIKGSNLREIIIPNSVKEIHSSAFYYCRNLKSVILPNALESINEYTFYGCSSLREIVVPPSVRTIGAQAFSECKNLFGIVLPDGVMLDKKAFGYENEHEKYWCDNLTNVKYHSGKVATDLMEYFPPECPFVKSGGKLRNPDFDKPLLAKYHAATGATATPVVQDLEVATPDIAMESIDTDIPVTKNAQPKTFVLIIANEQYVKEAKVPYALNDGKTFERYCRQALGIPQKNIHKVENATLNNMKYEVDWLRKVLMAYKGEARAMVYYAGHGIPDEASKTAYLLPVDGYGSNVSSGYALAELYKLLSEQPSKSVTVFLDACFSGANRDGKMLASTRGVALKVKQSEPIGKLVVFSAAQDDETAYPLNEQQHGMFTYYLLKKVKEAKGDVTLGELSDYVTSEVMRQSIVVNGKMQTPNVNVATSLRDTWKTMKLK